MSIGIYQISAGSTIPDNKYGFGFQTVYASQLAKSSLGWDGLIKNVPLVHETAVEKCYILLVY
jgi:hypothetical protein